MVEEQVMQMVPTVTRRMVPGNPYVAGTSIAPVGAAYGGAVYGGAGVYGGANALIR